VSSLRLLVIQHEDTCPPEWFGRWWAAQGVAVDVLAAHTGVPVPRSLADGQAGLVVLGGEMGANDDAAYGWLAPTKSLIREVVGSGLPFLGICLGHQLASAALGGVVRPNAHGHATGLTPVALTPAGKSDALLGALPLDALAVQWNNDVVTELPAGAVQLATAPDGTVQAARFAPRAWGLQFHPECSPALFRRWTLDKPSGALPRADGIDVPAAARAIDAAEQRLRDTWEPVARAFAAAAALPLAG
jgi:GMP synthase (glutamine-hydrolysing)